MEEQLVSFETAKLAKNKGFKRSSLLHLRIIPFYNKNGLLVYKFKGLLNPNIVYTPTQSLLQRWLREKHLILVDITLSYHTSGWRYSIYKIHTIQGGLHQDAVAKNSAEGINTYEGALELGLQKALNLINYEKEEINKTSN